MASGARPWRTQWRLVNVVEGGSLLGRDVDSSKVPFSKTYMYVIRSPFPTCSYYCSGSSSSSSSHSRPSPPPIVVLLSPPPSLCKPSLLLLFDLLL